MTIKAQTTTNILKLKTMLMQIKTRAHGDCGLSVFTGYAGMGKTTSANMAVLSGGAYYIRASINWTAKDFVKKIAWAVNAPDVKNTNISGLTDNLINNYPNDNKPLIIDECDLMLNLGSKSRKMVETLREIHDSTGAPMILIGENNMVTTLKLISPQLERRIIFRAEATAATLDDARLIAGNILGDIKFDDEFLQKTMAKSEWGRISDIVILLTKLREYALENGMPELLGANKKLPIDKMKSMVA